MQCECSNGNLCTTVITFIATLICPALVALLPPNGCVRVLYIYACMRMYVCMQLSDTLC